MFKFELTLLECAELSAALKCYIKTLDHTKKKSKQDSIRLLRMIDETCIGTNEPLDDIL